MKRQYDLRSREISGAVGQLSAVRCPLAAGEGSNRGMTEVGPAVSSF